METLRKALEALLVGAASYGGVLLAQELRDPYSDLRLRLADAHDRIREVKR